MEPRRLIGGFALVVLGLLAPAAGAAPALGGSHFVPASDPHFRYQGRFDFKDPTSPVVVWEASRISVDFQGDRLAVRFSGVTGQAYFDASVDGATSILELREAVPNRTVAIPVPGPGPHHLVLFKRTEATSGIVHFLGIEIAPGAAVSLPPFPDYKMRMEFIGDSMLVGACVLDGDKDQWDDRRTHDAAYSFSELTAADFSADYENISVSGIGLATGFVDVLAGQVWDRIYPNATSPKANLGEWVPDVVIVLLGDNDDSYPRAHGLPFPKNFIEKYVSLVQAIRAAYPKTWIVLLNGGMWAGTHSEMLRSGWKTAVSGLETRDPGISHYEFVHWTLNHPRVADHRALADELDAWLKAQPFMRARLAGGG